MRVLFLDASRGVSARGLADALSGMGAASRVAEAVASLGLPDDPLSGALVGPRDVTALLARADLGEPARRLAADAMGRLLLAEAMRTREARRADAALEGRALISFVGVAAALEALGVERAVVSRVGVAAAPPPVVAELLADWSGVVDLGAGETDAPGAALLRALVDERSAGRPEPAWTGTPVRGQGALLGNVAP